MVVHRLAAFLGLAFLFELLTIAVNPRLHSRSVLKITKDVLVLRLRDDSWYSMKWGESAWRNHPGAIYETVFFQHHIRFIYPPISLLFYQAWQAASAIHLSPFLALKITLLLAMLVICVLPTEFLFRLLPAEEVKTSSGKDRWLARAIVIALVYTFLPLVNALFLGQVQTLLNCFLIAAAFFWLRGERAVPGLLLGLGCWLKPQMALFLVWGMLRRQWNFAISLAAMFGLGIALSLAIYGAHNTLEYLDVLSYLSRHGDALFTNQSLNGLLHRLMHIGSPVTAAYGYPPYSRTIYLATGISSGLLLLIALLVPPVRGFSGTAADFLVFAMATTMASPIAWEHHYGIFFLVFLLWMPQAYQSWKMLFLLLIPYFLMTDNIAPLLPLMDTRWTFLLSHVYFGGLGLYLWTVFRWQSEREDSVSCIL